MSYLACIHNDYILCIFCNHHAIVLCKSACTHTFILLYLLWLIYTYCLYMLSYTRPNPSPPPACLLGPIFRPLPDTYTASADTTGWARAPTTTTVSMYIQHRCLSRSGTAGLGSGGMDGPMMADNLYSDIIYFYLRLSYTTPFLINMCRRLSMFPVSDFDNK